MTAAVDLSVPGTRLAHTVGGKTITVWHVRPGIFNVTVYNGPVVRMDELCRSYPSEAEARRIAREYALQFKREAAEQKATDVSRAYPMPDHGTRHVSDPGHLILATAAARPDGYVARGKDATILQLRALIKRGFMAPVAKPGSRRFDLAGATITPLGRRRLAELNAGN